MAQIGAQPFPPSARRPPAGLKKLRIRQGVPPQNHKPPPAESARALLGNLLSQCMWKGDPFVLQEVLSMLMVQPSQSALVWVYHYRVLSDTVLPPRPRRARGVAFAGATARRLAAWAAGLPSRGATRARPSAGAGLAAGHHLGVGLGEAEADALRVLQELVGAHVHALGLRRAEGRGQVSARVRQEGGCDGGRRRVRRSGWTYLLGRESP